MLKTCPRGNNPNPWNEPGNGTALKTPNKPYPIPNTCLTLTFESEQLFFAPIFQSPLAVETECSGLKPSRRGLRPHNLSHTCFPLRLVGGAQASAFMKVAVGKTLQLHQTIALLSCKHPPFPMP